MIEDTNTSMVPSYREDKYEMLRNLPENDSIYKCHHCHLVFNIHQGGMANILTILKGHWIAFCPECGQNDSECICKVDLYSIYLKLQGKKCRTGEIIAGTELCPVCNRGLCPQCMNHNVIALSRVTGYMGDVNGWNNGKKEELKNRQHYNINR
jgi:rubrerythrin